jgi:hypothetical protein
MSRDINDCVRDIETTGSRYAFAYKFGSVKP